MELIPMKKHHILALGLPILAVAVLLIIAIVSIIGYFFLLPHGSTNATPVVTNPYSPITCIGVGCREAASTQYGGIYCDGYSCQTGNILYCHQTIAEYCRGCKPAEDPKACACTYNNVSARYCSINDRCYANQAELELLCVTDQTAACSETERNITNDRPSDIGCGAAMRTIRGLKEEDCNRTWREIYPTANATMQSRIREITGFGQLCISFCDACNSSLCQPGQLCERASQP